MYGRTELVHAPYSDFSSATLPQRTFMRLPSPKMLQKRLRQQKLPRVAAIGLSWLCPGITFELWKFYLYLFISPACFFSPYHFSGLTVPLCGCKGAMEQKGCNTVSKIGEASQLSRLQNNASVLMLKLPVFVSPST